MSRSVYVVAGEVSGDTHAAELMGALRAEWPEVSFRGLGGPEMCRLSRPGVQDWVDEAAVVGVWEVLRRYSWFKKRFDIVLAEIVADPPDILLLVDYPGFNLRLAKAVKDRGLPTKIVHYVAPQVWAWNRKRIPRIAATHDLMLCFFPFEVPLFEEAGLRSRCPGHPLVDELGEQKIEVERDEKVVGLFPGSRTKEVSRLFPVMCQAAERLHQGDADLRFVVAAASEKVERLILDCVAASSLPEGVLEIQTGTSQRLMQTVTCGVVASGTATLEAAYYGMPYCLVYRVAWPTYLLARQLIKLPHIGLVNILAGEEVVPELIQHDANPDAVAEWLEGSLRDPDSRAELSERLLETASQLGDPGVHGRAAREIALLFQND